MTRSVYELSFKHRRDGRRARRPEQLKRLLPRRHEPHLHPTRPMLKQMPRGHQRQLVERQRPDPLGNNGSVSGHPPRPAVDQLLNQITV